MISSSIFVCSCWKDFGDVGISIFFFLGLVPVLAGTVKEDEYTEEGIDEA